MSLCDSYISRVTLIEGTRVEAEAVESNIFKHLKSYWQLNQLHDGKCEVEFFVDFEFSSYIYAYAANIFFLQVSKGMISAFEARVKHLNELKSASKQVGQ